MKFKETKIVVILAVVFVLLGSVYAADLIVPHTFSPGTTAKSSEMNENLATIYWDADSAINSNPNIGLDSNENAFPVPPMLHEIMMQHDLTGQLPLNMMINDDPFSNPNNREILGLPVNASSYAGTTGATISGAIFETDGVTPIAGKNIYVTAFTGSPCSDKDRRWGGQAWINSSGTYTIPDLPAGTYYLVASIGSLDNYVSEWWASPLSVRECTSAQSIVVTEGQTVTGKNFQLDPGATISGTIFEVDGVTPLTGKNIYVTAFTGSPCGSYTRVGGYASVNSATGIYTIPALPAGTYYLKTSSDYHYAEWWASLQSVRDCASAQSTVVTEKQTVTNKNFQLDPEATISGTVYQNDGVTPTGKDISVDVYTGSPCGSHSSVFTSGQYNTATGIYTLFNLPAGTYYLQANNSSFFSSDSYLSEWWASPRSVRDCSGAQSIVVTEGQTVTGKNFQLDTAATISGTVYQSDGVTPLTGKHMTVHAYTGSPCGSGTYVGYALVNSATGTYTIPRLPAGAYYLETYTYRSNYISEWWASPLSVRDCAGAQSIVVTEGQTVTGKNFQLDPGATISGTIFEVDGVTPLTGKGIEVAAYTGSPCGSGTYVGGASVNSATGTYTTSGLPAGAYYLKTSEWWASPLSVRDCAGAQSIVVTEGQIVTGKNFQLDTGTLFVTDGVSGIWKWDGSAWSQLTSTNPENMVTSGSTLYVDFGTSYGLYKWYGDAWAQLTPANPENMVASGSTLYVDFGATYGLYKWDGAAWNQLTSGNPENIIYFELAGFDFLYKILCADFGATYGLWKWDGTAWSQLTPANPENMVASGSAFHSELYVDFGATYGLYKWDGTTWSQLTPANPENMVTSGSTLYVDFGALGIYKWNGAAWSQLSSTNPENIVAFNSTLYVDFGASYGLYKWDGASWDQLSSTKPENMVTTGSTLYVDFGALGIYKWNGSSWTQLTGSNPVLMVVLN
jgi:hypothetical protein